MRRVTLHKRHRHAAEVGDFPNLEAVLVVPSQVEGVVGACPNHDLGGGYPIRSLVRRGDRRHNTEPEPYPR